MSEEMISSEVENLSVEFAELVDFNVWGLRYFENVCYFKIMLLREKKVGNHSLLRLQRGRGE